MKCCQQHFYFQKNCATITASYTYLGTNRPPRKWRPVNFRTPSFGAVRLTSTSGCKTGTPSSVASPRSTSQPDGMSTDTIGKPARAMSGSATSNGARTGGLNEKPKIASRTTSLAASAVESVFSASLGSGAGSVGMSMFVHWVCRRCRERGTGGAVNTTEQAGRRKRTLYMSFDPGCSVGSWNHMRGSFRQTGTMIVPWASKSSVCIQTCLDPVGISPVALTRLFNGCTQMSSSDQPISSLVPWSATDQHAWISLLCIDSCDRLGARKTSEFHELLVRRDILLR